MLDDTVSSRTNFLRTVRYTTLAYYAANTVETVEPQELDPDERIRKRNEFLENAYKKTE